MPTETDPNLKIFSGYSLDNCFVNNSKLPLQIELDLSSSTLIITNDCESSKLNYKEYIQKSFKDYIQKHAERCVYKITKHNKWKASF